jgi:molybdopterin biosynthesis enzyme
MRGISSLAERQSLIYGELNKKKARFNIPSYDRSMTDGIALRLNIRR